MRTGLLSPIFLCLGLGACTGAVMSSADSGSPGASSGGRGAGTGGLGPAATGGSPQPGTGGARAGTGGGEATGGALGNGTGGGSSGSGGVAGTGGAANSGGANGTATGGRGTAGMGAGTGGRATGSGGAAGGRGGGLSGGGGGAGGGGGTDPGGWLAGYTATMFGNVSTASDCAGVANFSDMTNISTAACTHQGVTIAPFMSGTANNASYYGAPGDESSIWMGPLCRCQNGALENAAGVCAQAPSCNMEADCGRCFEIKCDPAGTATYSDGATRVGTMYCNRSQSVVIEVVDACPHNHPSNTWWCTNQRRNHIDISCSAMRGIAGNPNNVGSWGWLNVQVRPVSCAVGLGVKPL